MKSKERKLLVFWVINIELLIVLILMIFFSPQVLLSIGIAIIVALVGNGACYIGGNVWHAWQKSKYFKIALSEDAKEEITGSPNISKEDYDKLVLKNEDK